MFSYITTKLVLHIFRKVFITNGFSLISLNFNQKSITIVLSFILYVLF
jgi:hypothetical protein